MVTIFFGIHIIVSVVIGYYLFHKLESDHVQAKTWTLLGLTFSLFIPFFGSIGIVTLHEFFLQKRKTGNDKPKIKCNEHLGYDSSNSNQERVLDESVDWKGVKEVVPMADVFKFMDIEYQKGAVDTLASKRDKKSIKILKDSLKDSVPEVRYFTVDALTKISKFYSDKILEAQLALKPEPDSVEKITQLGDCFYEYGVSGVEDEYLSNHYFNEAAKEYRKALKNDQSVPLLLKYGEVLRKLGRLGEALEIFNQVTKEDKYNKKAMIGILDIYFQMGRNEEIKAIAIKIKKEKIILPQNLKKAFSAWV